MVAKVRPCLVVSVRADENADRVLTTLVPHTTSTRDSRFEVASNVRFRKAGAFDAQNIIAVPTVKLVRRLGSIPDDQMTVVEQAIKLWLGFNAGS
jgi:mRNA interferase MazF